MTPASATKELTAEQAKAEPQGDDRELTASDKKSKAKTAVEEFAAHLHGCPVTKGRGREGAVETYVTTAPAIKDRESGAVAVPSRRVRVTRCVECAGHAVDDPRGDAYRTELSSDDDEDV